MRYSLRVIIIRVSRPIHSYPESKGEKSHKKIRLKKDCLALCNGEVGRRRGGAGGAGGKSFHSHKHQIGVDSST